MPRLMQVLAHAAPQLRVIVHCVQFRTVAAAFTSGAIDLAVKIAEELPAGIVRRTLFTGGFGSKAVRFGPRCQAVAAAAV